MSVMLLRFTVGRALIHAGLAVMPHGRVRRELTTLLLSWSRHVRAELAASGTPTRRAETIGSVAEGDGGPVGEAETPNNNANPSIPSPGSSDDV
jgi:hypothetical protein